MDLRSGFNYKITQMRSARVTAINPKGLRLQSTARFLKVTPDYKLLFRMGRIKMADNKSILSSMILAAIKGTLLKIETEGID